GGDIRNQGTVKGDTIYIKHSMGGMQSEKKISLKQEIYLSSFTDKVLFKKGLFPGARYDFRIIDEMTGQVQNTSAEIKRKTNLIHHGKQQDIYVVNLTTGGIEAQYWIREDGTLVRSLLQGGQMMTVACTEEQARKEITYPDLVTLFKVPVKGLPINNRHELKSVKVKFIAPEGGAELWPNSRQKPAENNSWIFHAGSLKGASGIKPPVYDDSLKSYLSPTTYIQSNDDRIIKKAAELVGNQKSLPVVVKNLNTWVHGWLKNKDYGMGFGSALDAMEKQRGDCTEHAMLFAALCKAAGIPTRIAVGLVASSSASFDYHMWAQVFLGEWMDVDPGLNQFPIDATHIMFFAGNMNEANLFPISQLMFKILGKVEIEVMDVETD
ncbi:MAG: transglutaminase-like domain-containing protein, partial [bacterium]